MTLLQVNKSYTKKDLYKILSVPIENQKGAWDTGYREYDGNIYIFANVGIPGRTGSDYNNYWDGELFYWEAKTNSNPYQPLIKKMTSNMFQGDIHLFTRTDNSLPFTYEGKVVCKRIYDKSPVTVIWQLDNRFLDSDEASFLLNEPLALYEGGLRQVLINKYERNPLARRLCIEHFGYSCHICTFHFLKVYGEIGRDYIHVHHIVPLSSIGEQYRLDPIADLIPICPNCHSMIHRTAIPLSITELKNKFRANG